MGGRISLALISVALVFMLLGTGCKSWFDFPSSYHTDDKSTAFTPAPEGVDSGLWQQLNQELERQLALRSAKFVSSQLPPADKHRVDDLTLNVEGNEAWLSWTYKNPGDYDLNGEVNGADLVPIAQRFNARSSEPGSNYLALVDGDGNGEINAGDIATIAQNWENAMSGYALGFEYGDADANGEITLLDLTPLGFLIVPGLGEYEAIDHFTFGDFSDFGKAVEPGSPGDPGPYVFLSLARPSFGKANAEGRIELKWHVNPHAFLEGFQLAVAPVILNSPPYYAGPVVNEENMGEIAVAPMPAPVEE